MDKKAKFTLNKIGVFYSVFGAVTVAMQYILASYLTKNHREFLLEYRILISLLISMVITDLFGVLLVYILTMNMPKCNIPKRKLSAAEFLKYYSMCPTIVLLGGLFGNMIQKNLFGVEGNAAGDILSDGSYRLLTILAVGIFAPIFEELIFRKILIDHLVHRGKLLAILVSGLSFGLFHGNFSQCFFAMGFGFLFAYVYIKTGNVWYTIAYHFINNMASAIVNTLGNKAAMVYAVYMLIVAVVGFVVFAQNARYFKLNEVEREGKLVGKKAVAAIFTSYGMIMFFVVCGVVFYKTYS